MYSLFLTPSNMIPFQNPTIYLGTLRIDEPVSAITDIIICLVCFYGFYKTKALSTYKPVSLYRWFFLFTGLSTLVAAIMGHAFLYYFGANAKMYGWLFGIAGTSFAQFAAMYNTRQLIGESIFKKLILINTIEVMIATTLVFVTWSFVVVEVHTAYGLLLNVVVLEFFNYKKTDSPLSIKVIYGISIAVVAVFCHIFKFAYSNWFNHIDLSHIFMALSIYVIYKGISLYENLESKFGSV